MKSILLHTCCGPCCCYVIEKLQEDGFDITLFYYNPNIHPREEYDARLAEIKKYSDKIGVNLVVDNYEVDKWFKMARGLEGEPEGGKRCEVCFKMRLERTAKYALKNKFDYFGTTLTISPHKNAEVINKIGKKLSPPCNGDLGGCFFYEADWKKQDGFKKSCQISRQENFYRQNYCGCVFSRK